ncbi:E3 ubiquitin-protein ligase RING1-like [Iris pallida]|uniref:RING-type E3 ubiquitin transferase n=1 Tax=Iris pallida TaxID=29817 RepID=A0AAX6HYY4_IRIPA|nr:E3 ubiquitin-protein ligase RING1-like [Iris pallida]
MEGGGLVVGRYWCHMCSQEVNPVTEVVEMKCPQCNSGFIEHLEEGGGEEEQGGGPTAAAAANDPTTDLSSERALSLWAPILLGMLASHRDDGFLSLLRRRQQRSSAVLQLLHGLQESNDNGNGGSEREGQHMILVNPFSQAVIVRAPFNNADNGGGGDNSSSRSSNSRIGGGVSLGDYFVGPGLEQLLQHLAENDPNRYGTPPAQKEAVEAMPTVEVGEKTNCPVCLEEFEIGEEAREMPCRHRFHGGCIVPWLEMHSSCPLCRFQMPVDGDKDSGSSGGGGSGENNAARRFWLPVPLPFSGLFSFSLNSQQSNMMNENGNNSSFVLESSSSHTNTNENGTDSSSVPTSSSAVAAPTSSSSTTATDTTATAASEGNSNSHSQEEY